MRALVQRVTGASVSVEGTIRGSIGRGLLIFLAVAPTDTAVTAARLAAKAVSLRIFEDDDGRMNRSVTGVSGSVLCISQFTLYADTRRGNRPSFTAAAGSDLAETLYRTFCDEIAKLGVRCERGVFGARMVVELTNDGPVTILLDSGDLERPRRA